MQQAIILTFAIVCLFVVTMKADDAVNNTNVTENKYPSFVNSTSLNLTGETNTTEVPQDIQGNETYTANNDSEVDSEDNTVQYQYQEIVEIESEDNAVQYQYQEIVEIESESEGDSESETEEEDSESETEEDSVDESEIPLE